MAIDNIGVIEEHGARVLAALEANPTGKIPWSADWTVAACAQHVGSAQHVVSQVVKDRPTADFGLFRTLAIPDIDDPGLAGWVAEGIAADIAQFRSTDPDAECWSWWPEGHTAGFWQRRMAQEMLVHRWDAELGAGIAGSPMVPSIAADGVDEYLDVFAGLTRSLQGAPAGPSIHLHCTDTDGEWLLLLPEAGRRVLTREHAKADVALRGPAEGLLLFAWGRLTPDAAGIEVLGDAAVIDHWSQLIPSM